MDLVVWNNDLHVGIRENLEIDWNMFGREGNAYVGQNDAWGNTESDALGFRLEQGAALLAERNLLVRVGQSICLEGKCRQGMSTTGPCVRIQSTLLWVPYQVT